MENVLGGSFVCCVSLVDVLIFPAILLLAHRSEGGMCKFSMTHKWTYGEYSGFELRQCNTCGRKEVFDGNAWMNMRHRCDKCDRSGATAVIGDPGNKWTTEPCSKCSGTGLLQVSQWAHKKGVHVHGSANI